MQSVLIRHNWTRFFLTLTALRRYCHGIGAHGLGYAAVRFTSHPGGPGVTILLAEKSYDFRPYSLCQVALNA